MLSEKPSICPYLGLESDPESCMAFPSAVHRCYRHKRGKMVDLLYQREVCLTSNYETCKIYQKQKQDKLEGIESAEESKADQPEIAVRRVKSMQKILLRTLGIGILLGGLFWLSQTFSLNTLFSRVPAKIPSTSFFVETATANEPSPDVLPTPTFTPLPPSTPSATVIPTLDISKHTLDTPIGSEQKFIIHQARPGESLAFYASVYNNTIESIVAVNYRMLLPLQEGTLVIIPVDAVSTEGLPSFEAYQVTESIILKDLVSQLGVSAADILFYNELETDNLTLPPGTWLLIPR